MYEVTAEVTLLWRALLSSIIAGSGLHIEWFDHAAPTPIAVLWRRSDLGAVFMCGLPFSQSSPQPLLIAAPVTEQSASRGEGCYWSEFVVRADSRFYSVDDCFGGRLALTVPGSQSGCAAPLEYFESLAVTAGRTPLFAELVAPTITPIGALQAVIGHVADIAPVDSYALSLIRAYRPDLACQVRVVGQTTPTPMPALVASPPGRAGRTVLQAGENVASESFVERLSAAFLAAHATPSLRPLMDGLLLQRFSRPRPESYDVLAERFAATAHFWRGHPIAGIIHPSFVW